MNFIVLSATDIGRPLQAAVSVSSNQPKITFLISSRTGTGDQETAVGRFNHHYPL
ncbi:MAG: hypothetical protein H6573_05025 [Lewinellaceae bacterium]|nr:hypothetical protein [Phaeodactylibacter sp.]MCB9346862.1 hypothetical protein [Lewinellaceae bacterium]